MTLQDAAVVGDSRRHAARSLFDDVIQLRPERQRTRLHELTGDPRLIVEVERLIDEHTRALDRDGDPLNAATTDLPDTELNTGDTLGAWRLVERLASGGMGTVFIAERADQLYRQRVAIKLMRGPRDAATAQRMAAERQLLAQLQHPGIARLYDGGTTPAGQPYLVMEYVDGQPLDRYCAERRPGLAARIALFQRICRAVQAAHQHLIVHCDLKPANVVVRADGAPVLLDFGIARALGAAVSDDDGYCTPTYASPELRGRHLVSTASDVFSLGVILTELLSARRVPPLADGHQSPSPLPSALAEHELPWRQALQGDLDAIVGKACALDANKRYASVAELHDDLQRFGQHQPVRARTLTLAYRLRRLLRRRWREAGALALVMLLSAGFIWRVDDQRRAAQRAAATAEQVSDLLVSAFAAADPKHGNGSTELSARDVLDVAAAKIKSGRIDDLAVLARLRGVLGYAYLNLGQPQLAEPLMAAAIEGYLDPAVGQPLQAARILSEMSVLHNNGGYSEKAVAAARRSLALREAADAVPLAIADSWNALGIALTNVDNPAAARALSRALDMRREFAGEPSRDVAAVLHNLGRLQHYRGHPVASEDFYRQALTMKDALETGRDASYEASLSGLAVAVRAQGRLAEAAKLQRDILQLTLQLYGDGVKVGRAHNELAYTYHDLGLWSKAATQYVASERITAATVGTNSIGFAISLNNHAYLDQDRGAIADAERRFRRSLAIRESQLASDHPSVLHARLNLGRLLLRNGQLAEAGRLIDNAWAIWQRQREPQNPSTLEKRLLYAEWLIASGHPAEAAVELDAIAGYGLHDPRSDSWLYALQARISSMGGNPQVAAGFRRKALQTMARALGKKHVETARRRVAYAASLGLIGKRQRARAELASAVAVLAPRLDPSAPLRRRIHEVRVALRMSPRMSME